MCDNGLPLIALKLHTSPLRVVRDLPETIYLPGPSWIRVRENAAGRPQIRPNYTVGLTKDNLPRELGLPQVPRTSGRAHREGFLPAVAMHLRSLRFSFEILPKQTSSNSSEEVEKKPEEPPGATHLSL